VTIKPLLRRDHAARYRRAREHRTGHQGLDLGTAAALPEGGFDAATVALDEIPDAVRANAAAWAPVLARANVRVRPSTSTWSPLEYGCHVRDTCRVFAERLELMLTKTDPVFVSWNQDETAIAERYGEQDPATVAAELARNARAIADAFARVEPDHGAGFTVASLGRYFLHDPVHHLHDVGG
jgi:hypothetical protein